MTQHREYSWDWFEKWIEHLETEACDDVAPFDPNPYLARLTEEPEADLRALLRISETEEREERDNRSGSTPPAHEELRQTSLEKLLSTVWDDRSAAGRTSASSQRFTAHPDLTLEQMGSFIAPAPQLVSSQLNGELKAVDFLNAILLKPHHQRLFPAGGTSPTVRSAAFQQTTAPQTRALASIRRFIQQKLIDDTGPAL